ncbi:MAG: WG repeat-containing protein [Bacteroidia bacterium]|nr:WG repeat-containing protein [Bacteroidia bacterium]
MRKIFFLAMLVSAFVPLYAQSTHPEGLSFYNEKSHWGIVDVKGNTIIPFEFGNSLHFSEGLAPARKIRYLKDKNGITRPDSLGGLFGYINEKGEWVIPPAFEYAEGFKKGVAKVWKEEKQYMMDKNGNILLFTQNYKETEQIENGLYLVTSVSGKSGITSENGQLLLDSIYTQITPDPVNRVFIVREKEEYGVFGFSGKWIFPMGKYDNIDPFIKGYATVSRREGHFEGFIDTTGREYFFKSFPERTYLKSTFYSDEEREYIYEKLLIINLYGRNTAEKEGSYSSVNSYEGYCNLKGEIVIDNPEFRRCFPFYNGRAIVSNANFEDFVINKKGEVVGGPFQDHYGSFQGGFCWVKQKKQWQYIDTLMLPLFKNTFKEIDGGFVNGKCKVKTEQSNWIWIDTKGDSISLAEPSNELFEGDFAVRAKEEKFGIKDKEGNILIPFVYNRLMVTRYPEIFLATRNDTTGYLNTQNQWICRTLKTSEGMYPVNLDYMLRGFFYAGSSQPDKETGIGGYARYHPNKLEDGSPAKISPEWNFPDQKLSFQARQDTGKPANIQLWIANLSGKDIHFPAQDSRLEMTIEARTRNGIWEEVMYLPDSWCGNSYHTLQLASGECWKFDMPIMEGSIPATFRARISIDSAKGWFEEALSGEKSQSNQLYYSNEWEGSVNPAQFWRQKGYTPSGIMDPYNE